MTNTLIVGSCGNRVYMTLYGSRTTIISLKFCFTKSCLQLHIWIFSENGKFTVLGDLDILCATGFCKGLYYNRDH